MTGCLQELEGRLQELEAAWALRRQRCAESWGLQKLRQRLEQAEAWLACREGLLLKPDYGVSRGPAPSLATRLRAPPEGVLPLRWLPGSGHPPSWASPKHASPQHSVSDVELLLHRHRDLEKLLAAQEEKFAQMQKTEVKSASAGG